MKIADARRRAEELRHLNAFISMTREDGDGPVLAVKDLLDVAGVATTGGGTILPGEPAAADAPSVARMRVAGYVVVGKTNLHEFAWGITSLNPHYGPVRNPHDPDRIAGGSSGGSAVAVAAGMADVALGTDTGGSIRIPAALCGVVGFKPTLGSIPTDGVIPLSPSFDTVGPLAPTVEACAEAFALMTESNEPLTNERLSNDGPKEAHPLVSPRLAVPEGWIDESEFDDEVAAAWRRVAHSLPRVPFPDRVALARAADTALPFEAYAYHRRWFEATPERYGPEMRARLTAAARVTEREYRAALDELARLRGEADSAMRRIDSAMRRIDALVVPTVPIVAPTIADATARDFRAALTQYTRPFNATGQPVVALPLPAPWRRGGAPALPVGIQLVGRAGEDWRLLWTALHFERAVRKGRNDAVDAGDGGVLSS